MTLLRPLMLGSLLVSGTFCFMPTSPASESFSDRFGFAGPEIFPIDNQIGQLHMADLDGDGLNDLVLANNARSKITLLYNQTGKTNVSRKPKPTGRRDFNELPPDARFRIESIASEKRIAAMVLADFNDDGRPDIVYYGEPKELVLQYNQGTNGWSTPKRWPIEDGQLSANALSAGDLNGDGRPDLILLAESFVYTFLQTTNQGLAEPSKIPFSGVVKSAQIVDIDGNGRNDLLLVNWEDRNPFRFRLQMAGGELGPENYFTFSPIRSYWADNLETNGKTQVITIAQNSGRAQISEFTRKPSEALTGVFRQGQMQLLALSKTDKAKRGVLWADVNGDHLSDLLIAEPESGKLSIQLQQDDGTLSPPKTFPTLAGVTDVAVADWDESGAPEIFLLSADEERQVGVTRLNDKNQLPFPTLIPVEGKPLVFAVGTLKPGAKATLAIITDQEGKRSLLTRTAEGHLTSQKLSEDFKANPASMTFHDVDQDGLTDLIVLIPYEKVKVLRQVQDNQFEELDIVPPGGTLEQPWLSTADVDGDGKAEVLLSQKNFLRAVVLKTDSSLQNSTNRAGWGFSVKEQINGAANNSRLVSAAAVPNGTNAIASLFLLDAERKALTLSERDSNGVWQVVRNLPLPVSDFRNIKPINLGSTKTPAVTLLGLNVVGYLPLAGDVWDLTALDGYESPIKDSHLNDVVTGDLNNDGRKDLVFLETARNYLDLVIFDANHKLIPANRWQVFEERTFRSRRSDLPEPREALVGDLTGDGKNDLVVVVHDRILLYPQE